MADNQLKLGIGKYRGLAASIIVLVILVVTVLIVNLFFSDILRKEGQTATVIGSQSVLINQVTADLLSIESPQDPGIELQISDLKRGMDNFEKTLNTFFFGGVVQVEIGSEVVEEFSIDRLLLSDESYRLLLEARTIWKWYSQGAEPIVEDANFNSIQLVIAKRIADTYTERLAFIMSTVSRDIQDQIESDITNIQNIQYVGIALTLFMLAWTIFVTVRNLRKNDNELEQARRETVAILDTVQEGLFLLDEDLIVSGQYSVEAEGILESNNIAGRSFTELVEGLININDMETVREFVALLFDARKVESLIDTLNPMEDIKVSFVDEHGEQTFKYLGFTFRRVMQSQKIVNVLVSVRDISEEVILKQQLESAKDQGVQQLETLISFSHVDPAVLTRFLSESRRALTGINTILKEPVSNKRDFQTKADKIFVEIHKIKGEAAAMEFDELADKAHDFEEGLKDIRRIKVIQGLDFLPLVVRLDDLISYTDNLNEIAERFGNNNQTENSLGKLASVSTAREWDHLYSSVDKIAAEVGKQVNFVMSGLVESGLSERYRSFINSVGIQLIRNSLVHGIETPDERVKNNKQAAGRIDLRVAKLKNGSVEIIIRDDGQGFNIDKIRKKAIKENIASSEEVSQWPAEKVVSMVFKTGFSTVDEAHMHAGRGVGLDVVRQAVQALGGKVRLSQLLNKYCQFEIILPPMVDNNIDATLAS